jgi:FdhE protein
MEHISKNLTPDQVKKAAEAIRWVRPAYASFLDFYERVFMAQEKAAQTIRLERIDISEEMRGIKIREKMPLINRSDFLIDRENAKTLLSELCGIASAKEGGLPSPAEKLGRGEALNPDALFDGVLKEDNTVFETAGLESGIDSNILEFLAYHSILPSIKTRSLQLAEYLKDVEWNRGYCPVCGGLAALSTLQGEGKRNFHCSFCWHEWETPRVFCPSCQKEAPEQHQYFYSEDEEEYRVELCETEKTYIKTVDIRKLSRIFHPVLEHLVTLHLDIAAQEKGYQSYGGVVDW